MQRIRHPTTTTHNLTHKNSRSLKDRYSCRAFWVIPRAWVDWHAVGEILAERCMPAHGNGWPAGKEYDANGSGGASQCRGSAHDGAVSGVRACPTGRCAAHGGDERRSGAPSEPAGTAIPVANHDIVDTFWDIPPITFPTDLYDAGGAGAPSGPRPPQSAALTPPASYAMCTSCTATCRPPGYPSSESVIGQPASIDICHNVRK